MKFGKRLQELIYSVSTNDKYAEFDSRKSFNRINKPRTETEANLLSHHGNHSTSFVNDYEEDSNFERYKLDGVHETRLAWRHIKNWARKNSPDLNSSLQKACTDDDLNDFQKDLNIILPNCILEFFKLTDGQYSDDFNKVGGLFFGLKIMSLDDILVMTEHWRKVAKQIASEMSQLNSSDKLRSLPKMNNYRQSNSSFDLINSSTTSLHSVDKSHPKTTVANYPSQRSIPPGTIQPAFAHPMWIPLITDEVGNCIGVDLAPPVTGAGNWGQIILFGREFDTKFLIADNWGDFLLIFANDLESGNWDIKEPTKNNYGDLMIGSEGDLVFVDKESKTEINYLTVLKKRCISKWIDSLSKADLDEDKKELIKDLKLNPDSILNVKNVNDNSIDIFINQNLNLVNDMLTPYNNPSSKPAGDKPAESKDEETKVETATEVKPASVPTKQPNKPSIPLHLSDAFDYTEDGTLDDITI